MLSAVAFPTLRTASREGEGVGRGCLRGGGDAKFYIIATQSSLFPKNTSSIRMGVGAG